MWTRPAQRQAVESRRVFSSQAGFTLVELILVVAIIAVLTAIAIPAMHKFKRNAFDARALHDLANAIKAQEAHFATFHTYVSFSAVGPTTLSNPVVAISGSVTIDMTGDALSFQGTATSSQGSGKIYVYDSIADTIVGN